MRCLLSCVTAIGLTLCSASFADVAIIGHPSLPVKALTTEDAQRLFLKQKTTLNGGLGLEVRVLPASESASQAVYRQVLKMSESRLLAYWSKNIFTGQSRPPQEMSTEEELKHWVSRTPNALGYIDVMNVDDQVKVLLTIAQ